MAISTRIIKRRIKSISSTKKITKAMEMVAGAKMRRAVGATSASRPYAHMGWNMVQHLSLVAPAEIHPLLAVREVKNILVILVTGNRGLAGGFNANMVRHAAQALQELAAAKPKIDVITVGRKGEAAMRRAGWNIVASFTALGDVPALADALPIARMAVDGFSSQAYDKIVLMYTDFISALTQKPRVKELLPTTIHEQESATREYLFEPDPKIILDRMLERMVTVQIYQALLESSASEHSARMLAMRNATDAAGEMIDDLTFTFNQARQAAITREISEISGGKAALE